MITSSLRIPLLGLFLALTSCDRGLAPLGSTELPLPSISGKITFQGQWPVQDSARLLAVVLIHNESPFDSFPLKVADLLTGVSNGKIDFHTLNYLSSDTTFRFDVKPGSFSYLGIAEQFGPTLTSDWRAIGYDHDSLGNPMRFTVAMGEQIKDANIVVNFDSLPWQPFVK